MLDSGFSGEIVAGSATIRKFMKELNVISSNESTSSNSYMFGTGDEMPPVATIEIDLPALGVKRQKVDVVPGELPILIGRKFLGRHKILLDFAENITIFRKNGRDSAVKGSSAYSIPLDRETSCKVTTAAFIPGNRHPAEPAQQEDAVEVELAAEPSEKKLGSEHTAEGWHNSAGRRARRSSPRKESNLEYTKSSSNDTKCCFGCDCMAEGESFNVYTVLNTTDEDRELEEGVLRGYLGDPSKEVSDTQLSEKLTDR